MSMMKSRPMEVLATAFLLSEGPWLEWRSSRISDNNPEVDSELRYGTFGSSSAGGGGRGSPLCVEVTGMSICEVQPVFDVPLWVGLCGGGVAGSRLDQPPEIRSPTQYGNFCPRNIEICIVSL